MFLERKYFGSDYGYATKRTFDEDLWTGNTEELVANVYRVLLGFLLKLTTTLETAFLVDVDVFTNNDRSRRSRF